MGDEDSITLRAVVDYVYIYIRNAGQLDADGCATDGYVCVFVCICVFMYFFILFVCACICVCMLQYRSNTSNQRLNQRLIQPICRRGIQCIQSWLPLCAWLWCLHWHCLLAHCSVIAVVIRM